MEIVSLLLVFLSKLVGWRERRGTLEFMSAVMVMVFIMLETISRSNEQATPVTELSSMRERHKARLCGFSSLSNI